MINNIRDIETDKKSGKNTLAVIMGDKRSRLLYVSILVSAVCIAAVIAVVKISALLVLLCIPLMFTPVRKVLAGDKGLDLIPVLAKTALVQIVAGILLAIGIWL
jgi:1,4-dihydroxy-2-naphthoate octaprenyltransferase